MECPDVKSYLDVNQYLQDIYKFRKEASDSGFSYDAWAVALNVTSKSNLRYSILGTRKISESLAANFVRDLELEGVDKEYFLVLVLFTQCKQKEQRKIYARQLSYLLRASVTQQDVPPQQSLLADPLCLVVRNLLSFADIRRDLKTIANLTGLTEEKIRIFLEALEQNQLIKRVGDEWQACHDLVKVQDKAQDENIRRYHRLVLEKAIESQMLPVAQRYFNSLCIAFSEESYKEYLQEYSSFVKSVFAKFSDDQLSGKRVYQINMNLFPWTQTYAPEEKEPSN